MLQLWHHYVGCKCDQSVTRAQSPLLIYENQEGPVSVDYFVIRVGILAINFDNNRVGLLSLFLIFISSTQSIHIIILIRSTAPPASILSDQNVRILYDPSGMTHSSVSSGTIIFSNALYS